MQDAASIILNANGSWHHTGCQCYYRVLLVADLGFFQGTRIDTP